MAFSRVTLTARAKDQDSRHVFVGRKYWQMGEDFSYCLHELEYPVEDEVVLDVLQVTEDALLARLSSFHQDKLNFPALALP